MQKSIRLVSGLYIKLALLTAAVGFALRIVLLFNAQTTSLDFSFGEWLEIFLFGADRGGDLFAVDSEQFQNAFARAVERGHGFEQRRLFVERLARIGNKDGRDIERSLFDERGGSGIPSGITAGGASSSRPSRRERRSVGFSDDQGFPRELHNDAVAAAGFYEAVVLLRKD